MNEKISIREFVPSDVEYILKLHNESAENFEDIGINKDFIINISQRFDFKFLVAEVNDTIVGFVGILFYSNVGRGEIGPICVRKKFRNVGIGTILLNNAIIFLKKLGIRRVVAKVKAVNKEGLKFFLSNGFEKEGYFRNYTKKGEDIIQLVRFI